MTTSKQALTEKRTIFTLLCWHSATDHSLLAPNPHSKNHTLGQCSPTSHSPHLHNLDPESHTRSHNCRLRRILQGMSNRAGHQYSLSVPSLHSKNRKPGLYSPTAHNLLHHRPDRRLHSRNHNSHRRRGSQDMSNRAVWNCTRLPQAHYCRRRNQHHSNQPLCIPHRRNLDPQSRSRNDSHLRCHTNQDHKSIQAVPDCNRLLPTNHCRHRRLDLCSPVCRSLFHRNRGLELHSRNGSHRRWRTIR